MWIQCYRNIVSVRCIFPKSSEILCLLDVYSPNLLINIVSVRCIFPKSSHMRRFGEYTSNRHNISVALDPHGMPNDLKWAINGEIIINSANMY